jgi:hypothetical protein
VVNLKKQNWRKRVRNVALMMKRCVIVLLCIICTSESWENGNIYTALSTNKIYFQTLGPPSQLKFETCIACYHHEVWFVEITAIIILCPIRDYSEHTEESQDMKTLVTDLGRDHSQCYCNRGVDSVHHIWPRLLFLPNMSVYLMRCLQSVLHLK